MASKLSNRIQKIVLNFLEDPKYPSVGPHLRFLGLTGLWHPIKTPLTNFKLLIFYITITFFFSQYVKCLISLNPDSLQLILQHAPFHMGIVKACYFYKDYKSWEKLIEYTSDVEHTELAKNEEPVNNIIKSYVLRNRKVSYFFWALAFFSNITIFSEPYQKNIIIDNGTSTYLVIFDGYTPFSKEPPGYYASMFIQTVLGHIVSIYVMCWDTLVVSLMIFFAGQLKIVRYYCVHVVKENTDSNRNIAELHRFFITMIKFQKLFNSIISPVMFIYLIVISVNLGVNITQIAKNKDDYATLVSSCVYVFACLVQLLLFYWHGNEVAVQSTMVSYGTFESDWMMLDHKLQKEISLLGITTRKILVFKAGPFNEMSVATFIAILRASYSFFTLLNETK